MKIRPCPFCGGEGMVYYAMIEEDQPPCSVSCEECGSDGPMEESAAMAIMAWNRRRVDPNFLIEMGEV